MSGKPVRAGIVVGILLGLFAAASSAGATTFCVPGFSVACPNDGINVVPAGATPVAKLDTAMSTDATDGVADTVFVDSGTFTRTASTFQAPGSDRLTVVGAGRDQTFLTSSLTSNSYVVNLAPGSREVTMRDLTIVIPESFPDGPGYGSGVQAAGDSFESVDLINRNPRSSGFNQIGSGTFADVRVFSDNGSRLERAVEQSSCVSGNLIVTDLGMNGSDYGIDVGCPQTPVTVKGLRSASVDQPLVVNSGGNLTVENALIESGDRPPVDVYNSTAADTIVNLNQTTVVATGDSAQPGIRAEVADAPAATGAIRIRVENSVLAGFEKSWRLEAPTGPARGDVAFTARYSVVGAGSFRSGDVLVDTSERVGFGDPGFDGINDFHLAPDSPLIDAGDPAQALPDRDLDGNVRPLDGNGDGVAVRDVGAFEASARIVPGPPSKGLKLGAVKFRYRTGRGGRLTFRISGNAQVRAVFTPVPRKGKATPKRRTVRIFRKVKAGRVKLKLGRHLLRRGKYQLKLTAASPDGSSGAALARTVRVR